MYRYCKGLQRIEKVKVDTINWTDIWKVLKEISDESELLDEYTFIDLKDFLSWFNKNKFDLQTYTGKDRRRERRDLPVQDEDNGKSFKQA